MVTCAEIVNCASIFKMMWIKPACKNMGVMNLGYLVIVLPSGAIEVAYRNHWFGAPPWNPPKPHTSSMVHKISGGFAVSLRPWIQNIQCINL